MRQRTTGFVFGCLGIAIAVGALQPTGASAQVTTLGGGCGTTRLSTSTWTGGAAAAVSITGGPAFASGWVVLDVDDGVSTDIAGCRVHVTNAASILATFRTDAQGTWSLAAIVPPPLVGLTLRLQAIVFTTGGPFLSVGEVTPALRVAVRRVAPPTANPVSTRYGNTYPWSANVPWHRVFDIEAYGGVADGRTDNVAAFVRARDAAFVAGGGVVYFPAGDYVFSDSIALRDGVVIRGDPSPVGDARTAAFDPPSNLRFPRYVPSTSGAGTPNSTAFKRIGTASPQTDCRIGLVDVDVDRAAIHIVGDGLTNTNRDIVVMGVRTNNVAEPDPSVPRATIALNGGPNVAFQHAWQRHSYRFACNVRVQADANVLIANTRHNDRVTDDFEQPGYVALDTGVTPNRLVALAQPGQARFSYTNHYVISVNRSKQGGFAIAATPTTEPSLFRPGIAVRDNWCFHTMRVAIHAAGRGLVIQDNVVRDQPSKTWWLHPAGQRLVSNSATLENRAIDWSGDNVTVIGNDYRVYRHRLRDGPYYSVDGEGILIQECCGGSLVRGVMIANNTGNAYIGIYKTRDVFDAVIAGNRLIRDNPHTSTDIYVNANTNSTPYGVQRCVIQANTLDSGDIVFFGSGTAGVGNRIDGNRCIATTGTIRWQVATSPALTGNVGFGSQPVP